MGVSETLFERAQAVLPGGVNSPVRAFRAVKGTPRFLARAAGCRITDEDGREYVDFVGSWGPLLAGHAHPAVIAAVKEAAEKGLSFGAATKAEVEMAEAVCARFPSIEMVRMVNSGTEAVMSALRLARGATGRRKLIKFEGCYHGHCDAMLVQAGSGLMTAGIPDSAGVPESCTADTLTAVYNSLGSVERLFAVNPDDIAAVIVEPVAANMGVVPPRPGFLEGLRALCDRYGAFLIFDEVITGLRLGPAGAQGRFGVRPDLTVLGKIIGGGMPVGAYGGSRRLMELVAPCGPVYQAGTLSGNPVAMAAGLATLRLLDEAFYERLEELSRYWLKGMRAAAGGEASVTGVGALGCLFFTKAPPADYCAARAADTEAFARYFAFMLARGFYVAPSQFEALFLSGAHGREEIDAYLNALEDFFKAEKNV